MKTKSKIVLLTSALILSSITPASTQVTQDWIQQMAIDTANRQAHAYTGIRLNSLSQFDSKTYSLDFYLWFRFQGAISPQHIQFINTVEPIQLGTPIIEETFGKETYRLYRIKGHFKINGDSSKHQIPLTQQLLTISFRHRDNDRNHLIYVTDVLGMETNKSKSLLDSDWTIKDIKFYKGVLKQEILGNPKYFLPGNTIEYSTFNADILMTSKAYAYYALIPSQFVLGFLIFSGIMTLLMILVTYNKKINY
ncbi:hypothetical protein PN36_14685 [Candidatus Thiomargarita nelsonii]|uniref:Secreted protein n=1 Tax=Candidatus Thiomargarita nelsonii TaxID=1003181 RepID=A0A0A6P5S1_9GAMM|nr:hypothetical protein PN36_14685 [Candidatus Thiomargarita nelsonii]